MSEQAGEKDIPQEQTEPRDPSLEEAGQQGFSRRAVIGTVVLGIGALVAIDKLDPANHPPHDVVATSPSPAISPTPPDPEITATPERGELKRLVEAGMTKDWNRVSVWPGLAILPQSVQLHSSPTLSKKSRIDHPGAEQAKLIVQRPFMIGRSLRLNGNEVPEEVIGSEVMGTWLPGSNDIAYFDRWSNRFSIFTPTRSEAAVYSTDKQAIFGEEVTLEDPLSKDDLTWRYVKATHHTAIDNQPFTVNKVCGRSEATTNQAVATYAYWLFQQPLNINGLINLPGEKYYEDQS